jgi:hypothetical protein
MEGRPPLEWKPAYFPGQERAAILPGKLIAAVGDGLRVPGIPDHNPFVVLTHDRGDIHLLETEGASE